MGGQAGEVRATGARGRTNRAGPRSSTRGVYTHDAAAAATRREMYFSTIAVFFHLLLGGYYSTTTCGYYSTTARFSFHPASAHDHVRSRVGLIPKEQPSPSVGYYSTTTCGYYSTTARFSFFSRRVRFLFSTCAFRASARSPRRISREKKTPSDFAFSARIALLSNAIAGARGTRGARRERTAARASPSGRTQTRADGSRACLARFRSAPGDAREGRTQTRVKKKRSSRVTTAAIARRTRWTRTRTPGWRRRRARTSRRPSQRRASRPVRLPARSRD